VYFIATGIIQDLSEQEFVSCVPNQCQGGSPINAWAWLIETQGGGMTSNIAYPYVSGNGYVPYCPSGNYPIVAKITSYGSLPSYNEPNMAAWVGAKSSITSAVC